MSSRAQLELLALNLGQRFAEEHRKIETAIEAVHALEDELRAETRDTYARFSAASDKLWERLATIKDGEPGPAGPQGPPGENGKDGQNGKDGKDGKDGETVAGPTGEAGEKGDKGDRGDTGERGERGERGEAGEPGPIGKIYAPEEWRERVHYEGELTYRNGSTWCAKCDTGRAPPHEDWGLVALAGRDGRSGEPRGGWNAEEQYFQLDRVTLNGSEWVAKYDDPGPLPGNGWMLGAQRARGRPGDRGEQGPPGIGIKTARLNEWSLVLVLADGTECGLDLRPLFERYHEERGE